jgi:hypothetical protein
MDDGSSIINQSINQSSLSSTSISTQGMQYNMIIDIIISNIIIIAIILSPPYSDAFATRSSSFHHYPSSYTVVANTIHTRSYLNQRYQFLNTKEDHTSNDIVKLYANDNDNNINNMNFDRALSKIMHISSGHFKVQALQTFIKLDIPNILGNKSMTIHEIAIELHNIHGSSSSSSASTINQDALLRTMRLLTSLDVIYEELITIDQKDKDNNNDDDDDENQNDNNDSDTSTSIIMTEIEHLSFQLTPFGKLLQTTNLSSCILHWMERPLYNAWQYLPDHILGQEKEGEKVTKSNKNPFEQANNGISSDYFYNANDNPQSLEYANNFVQLISNNEIKSIVQNYDWSIFENCTIVDIGGYNGKVMGAIASHYPNVNMTLKCLDLPDIISSIDESVVPDGVELIEGDIMDPSTIPVCDVIFMKHFLDRCMWSEEETVEILKTCAMAVSNDNNNNNDDDNNNRGGMIILGEAVIPSTGASSSISNELFNGNNEDEILLSLDALYMLVGRERQRTIFEWERLAERANLKVNEIIPTSSPSCYIIILTTK